MARKNSCNFGCLQPRKSCQEMKLIAVVKGAVGPTGPTGPIGRTGVTGATGPTGGEVVARTTSTLGEGEEAKVVSSFERGVNYLDFYIPKGNKGDPGVKGDKGEKGESGFTDILGAMIVSYNDNPQTFPAAGLEIQSNGRFPLMHVQVDVGGIANLDIVENTIKFTNTGIYKIQFITNAYIKRVGQVFDSSEDFVSVAFRQVESDAIVAAATAWTPSECATNVVGQGIFIVNDVSKPYELVNTRPRSIFLSGCSVGRTVSQSLLSVPMVSIVITRML